MGLLNLLYLEGIMKKFDWVDELFNGWQAPSGEMIQTLTADQKKIVKRLKARSDEMQPVYEEIEKKINDRTVPRQDPLHMDSNVSLGRREVLRTIIDSAVAYEEKKALRDTRKTDHCQDRNLEGMQAGIYVTAKKLIEQLDSYQEKKENSLLTSEANTDPLYLLKEAGKTTGAYERKALFNKYVFPALKELSAYDGRYMPSLQDVLNMLVYEMDKPIIGRSPDIDAVMASNKTSYLDFVRGFHDCIEQLKLLYSLPKDFKLTDGNMASMAACALGMKALNDDSIRKSRKR